MADTPDNNTNNTNNDSNTPQLPSGNSNGNNNPLAKQEVDALDPEAKAKNNANKSIGDRINDVKDTVNKGKKAVEVISKIPAPVLIAILIIIIIIGVVGFLTSIPGLMIEKIKQLAKDAVNEVQSWFTTEANAYIDDEDVVDLANYLEEMEYDLVGYGFVEVDLDNVEIISDAYPTYTEVRELGYIYYERRGDDESSRYYNEAGEAYPGCYFNSLGILIDNSDGEIATIHDDANEGIFANMWDVISGTVRDILGGGDYSLDEVYIDKYGILRSSVETANSGEGIIESLKYVDTTLLRSYLLSDYRINTLRNDDDGILNNLWTNIKTTFGGYDAAWSKGLIKLYVAEEGLATRVYGKADGVGTIIDSFVENWIDTIEIDRDTSKLTIKSGIFNNSMTYDIDGWADRYGMNLEFLLSLHLATMAPDLVYAMLQSFDTEVQVYLNDSGDASVESKYVEISNANLTIDDGINLSDIKEVLEEGGFEDAADWLNDNALTEGLNGLAITKKNAQYILKNTVLESPPNCTGQAQQYLIEKSTYQTNSFLWVDTSTNPLANYGIDSTVDSEVYDEFDSYENYTTAEEIEFDPEHVAQAIGVDNASYETDDTYTWFSASDYGYDEDTAEAEITVDEEFATTETTKIISSYSTSSPATENSTKYFYTVKRVKQYITWEAEVDGEEVSYEWVIYKYLIYATGEQDITTRTTWSIAGTNIETTEGEEITYDTPEWVNTIMVEFIVREKTVDELIDAGIMSYDEETDTYIYNGVEVTKCSNTDELKCCNNCKKYVKKVIQALADVSDADYNTSTPYIARVLGSWFRDTYFVIPEEEDVAITDYKYENDSDQEGDVEGRSETELSMIDNSWGSDSTFVTVDEDYLADTGEYWTEYELDEDGDYLLYYMYPNGITSDTTMEDFLTENGYDSQEAAEEDGHVFVKKAVTNSTADLSTSEISGLVWSAYGFDSDGSSTGWVHIAKDDASVSDNTYIEAVYSMFDEEDWENDAGGFYYKLDQTFSITQVEDAQRSETNSTVKWLFKYRKYYIYDGTEATALEIAEDKEMVLDCLLNYLKGDLGYTASGVATRLGKYGRSALRQTYSSVFNIVTWDADGDDLIEQWLEWQLDMYYSGITNDCPDIYIILTDDIGFIEETDSDGNVTGLTVTTDLAQADRVGDPRDPDLISTVNIDKTSLEAFTILENTGTLAAEYAYRDFKELIVELDYFDKEDLSDAIASVFTWIIPDISEIGWPIRPYDKQDVDYGALIESAGTYEFLDEINYEVDEDGDDEPGEDEPGDDDPGEDGDEDSSFKGYQGDELVSSPVTGKVIEYGTHERTNVYTEETEEVGYIIIEALDSDSIFTTSNVSDNYGASEDISDSEIATALNSFYDEYEDTCAGYTVMIDGIKVDTDLSIEDALLALVDDEDSYGSYEQNEVAALYNSNEQATREAAEQAKDDAPFMVVIGEDIYIKEGKYIGTTYTDDEASVYVEIDDEGNTVLDEEGNPIEGPANYIRIILKDTDYTVIDNVEDYFDIPEPESSSSSSAFTGDYSEEMLYWLLVMLEGKGGGDSGRSWSEIASTGSYGADIGDSASMTFAFGITNYCISYFSELGYDQYISGSSFSTNLIPLSVLRDVAILYLDNAVSNIQSLFPNITFDEYQMAALLSVKYNFGSIPDSLQDAINSGNEGTIASTWTTLGSSQWSEFPGLEGRRTAEYNVWSQGKYFTYSGSNGDIEITFTSSTPFTDLVTNR